MKTFLNVGLMEVQTHIILKINMCDNIFWSSLSVFTSVDPLINVWKMTWHTNAHMIMPNHVVLTL
jgi:hypothetical protein